MPRPYPIRSSRLNTSRVVYVAVLAVFAIAWGIFAVQGQALLVAAFATLTAVVVLGIVLQFTSAVVVWRRIAEVRRLLPDNEIIASWPLTLRSQLESASAPGSTALTIVSVGPSHVELWRGGVRVDRFERSFLTASVGVGKAGLTVELSGGASSALLFPLALSYGMFVPCYPTAKTELTHLFGAADRPRSSTPMA